jgi:hypothetical protein
LILSINPLKPYYEIGDEAKIITLYLKRHYPDIHGRVKGICLEESPEGELYNIQQVAAHKLKLEQYSF